MRTGFALFVTLLVLALAASGSAAGALTDSTTQALQTEADGDTETTESGETTESAETSESTAGEEPESQEDGEEDGTEDGEDDGTEDGEPPEPTDTSESTAGEATEDGEEDGTEDGEEDGAEGNEEDGTEDGEGDETEGDEEDGEAEDDEGDEDDEAQDDIESQDDEAEDDEEDDAEDDEGEDDEEDGALGSLPGDVDVSPSTAGAGAAAGAGALTTGVLGRRYLANRAAGAPGVGRAVESVVTTAPSPRYVAADLTARARLRTADWVGRVLAVGGYTKWAGREPLDHDTRATLYDYLQSEPGTYLSAFTDLKGVEASFGSVRYHLDILEREGLITSRKHRGKRRYYPVGATPDAFAIAMDAPATRAVIEALEDGPASVSTLADRLDRDPSTVTHHLSRLEDDGLVARERDGQSVTNRLTPGVRRLLEREQESPAAVTGD